MAAAGEPNVPCDETYDNFGLHVYVPTATNLCVRVDLMSCAQKTFGWYAVVLAIL